MNLTIFKWANAEGWQSVVIIPRDTVRVIHAYPEDEDDYALLRIWTSETPGEEDHVDVGLSFNKKQPSDKELLKVARAFIADLDPRMPDVDVTWEWRGDAWVRS